MDNFIYFNGKKGLGNAPLDNGTGIGKWLRQPDFHARTRLLTHELIHVRQYDAAGSGIVPFAYNYLYTFCTNGFKYASIPYEAQAKQIQLTSDPILWPPSHFKVWKGRGLKAALGFPTSATLTKGRMEFEKGVLEVHPSDTAKINRRFRYFVKGTPAYATYMAGACSPKTVLPPTSKACKSDDPPDACDPDWVAEYNKQCAAKQPPTTGEFAYQVM
ncbi:hypothetical protein DFJ74DRAFT_670352 [Hyaloraphidium curvatum]|nr:hypothetical protein DFJ74DRAFT_670352 [Hyaloraphidium curvatum]